MVENLVGRKIRKTDDLGLVAHSFDVELAGAVATLAAGFLGRRFSQCDRLEVGVAVEALPQVGVTGLTDLAAHVLVRLGWCLARRGPEADHNKTGDTRK